MSSRPKKRRRHHVSQGHPGQAPGTLHVPTGAQKPVLRVIAYGPGDCVERQIDSPDEVKHFIENWPVTWINVDGLGDAEVIQQLGTLLNLHPLALEDVLTLPQRAKVDRYDAHLFIVSRMVYFPLESSAEGPGPQADAGRDLPDSPRAADAELESEQISIFLSSKFVLTFQERVGDCLEHVRERIRRGGGRVRAAGADYLAYAIIDALIDAYYPVLEVYGDRLEDMEEHVFRDPESVVPEEVHRIKRDLLAVRRVVWPQREALSSLIRDESPYITADTRLYLRDAYDHVVQTLDMTETFRELCTGLQDFYLSALSNRMNEVMKVLTIIATIFIPMTFVTGIYGMNLYIPETQWKWTYLFFWVVMAVIAVGMLIFFRRKGWLGSKPPRRDVRRDETHEALSRSAEGGTDAAENRKEQGR